MTAKDKRSGPAANNRSQRRRYNQALNNVISLRINDDELQLLTRIREATSKSASEILSEAFDVVQRRYSPCLQG